MTSAGWMVMSFAVGGSTCLLIWCVFKVLKTPNAKEHLHTQTDIDPHDQD